jgi:hypothetical protein
MPNGQSHATVRDVLLDDWPFDLKNPNSDWQIFDSFRNDVSNQRIESITETMEVAFPPDDST